MSAPGWRQGEGSVTPGAVFPSSFQEMPQMRSEHSGPPGARCGVGGIGQGEGVDSALGSKH